MAKIVVITHEYDRFDSRPYLIKGLFGHWRNRGHEVTVVEGAADAIAGAVAIMHVDCSVVPEEYLAVARRFPTVINLAPRDIRKSVVSGAIIRRGDPWSGPVIVKSDLNYGGAPEEQHNREADARHEPRPHHTLRTLIDYPVFKSISEVPPSMRRDRGLVVERFLPEQDNNGFWLRTWVFFGDRERCSRNCSPYPIVKAPEVTRRERVPVPEALRTVRSRLGFDYGKFDFVTHGDEVTLLDANRTPGSAPNLSAEFDQGAFDLALGLESFLANRTN